MVEVVGSSPIIFTKYPPYPFGRGGYFSLGKSYRTRGEASKPCLRRAEDSTDAKTADTRCFPCALLKARVLSSSPRRSKANFACSQKQPACFYACPSFFAKKPRFLAIFIGYINLYIFISYSSKPACAGRRILQTILRGGKRQTNISCIQILQYVL